MRCQCSDVMEASCSDGWWAFWMGVLATWLPVYGAYRIMVRGDDSDEDDDAPDGMYS